MMDTNAVFLLRCHIVILIAYQHTVLRRMEKDVPPIFCKLYYSCILHIHVDLITLFTILDRSIY